MRIIGHLDMDAFFAAVEERDQEWLRGFPIVVGADPQDGKGRGVVSTANYKAREYGIKSALPISKAWQLSEAAKRQGKPPAAFVGTNFQRYTAVSQEIMRIIRSSAPLAEEASIDEAYFDLSFTGSIERAKDLCQKLKKEIKEKEHLTASIGVGPNKLIAKIASNMQKPDGLTVVRKEEAEQFLDPLPIRKIPGIGPKTETFFHTKGVRLVKDLKKYSREELVKMMGKWGGEIYEKIRGRDESPVVEEYEAKSIGEQETFPHDTEDPKFILERLRLMCKNVVMRLPQGGFTNFRTVTLTVRFADFETLSRSRTFPEPASTFAVLYFEALKLAIPFFDRRENPRRKLVRLIGVRVEKLD